MKKIGAIVLMLSSISHAGGAGPVEKPIAINPKTVVGIIETSDIFKKQREFFIKNNLYVLISEILDNMTEIDTVYTKLEEAKASLSKITGQLKTEKNFVIKVQINLQQAKIVADIATLAGALAASLLSLKGNAKKIKNHLGEGIKTINQLFVLDVFRNQLDLLENFKKLRSNLDTIYKELEALDRLTEPHKISNRIKIIGAQANAAFTLVLAYQPFNILFNNLFHDEQIAPSIFRKEAIGTLKTLKQNKKGLIGPLLPALPK